VHRGRRAKTEAQPGSLGSEEFPLLKKKSMNQILILGGSSIQIKPPGLLKFAQFCSDQIVQWSMDAL
jgi:hypothetical protein